MFTVCYNPNQNTPNVKKVAVKNLKRPCWKRSEIRMGSQGFLLLMELIMMARLQNITNLLWADQWQTTVMFCGLVIIMKNYNFINSRRPWLPILISHLFQYDLFILAASYGSVGEYIVIVSKNFATRFSARRHALKRNSLYWAVVYPIYRCFIYTEF